MHMYHWARLPVRMDEPLATQSSHPPPKKSTSALPHSGFRILPFPGPPHPLNARTLDTAHPKRSSLPGHHQVTTANTYEKVPPAPRHWPRRRGASIAGPQVHRAPSTRIPAPPALVIGKALAGLPGSQHPGPLERPAAHAQRPPPPRPSPCARAPVPGTVYLLLPHTGGRGPWLTQRAQQPLPQLSPAA